MKLVNLADKKFNKLTVLISLGVRRGKNISWLCFCECGKFTIVYGYNLSKHTTSCGCFRMERIRETNTRHGMSGRKNKEYKTWIDMNNRCANPNNHSYRDYGKRGITVCPEWRESFVNFYRDMGNCPEGYSIERINNSLGYSKDNCKWATKLEQSNNTRSNRFMEYNGKAQTLSQWARELGLKYDTLWARLYMYNWTMEKALRNQL